MAIKNEDQVILIDLDLMNETFEIVDGELWRIGGRVKKPILGLKASVYNDDGTKDQYITQRILYAMNNNVEIFDPLMIDDDGAYVPVPNNIRALVRLNYGDRVFKSSGDNRGYTSKTLNTDGSRPSKTFKVYNDAINHHKELTEAVWGEELKKYNLYNKYFDGYEMNISSEPMPTIVPAVPKPAGFRIQRWSDVEAQSLRTMYRDGMPLKEIAKKLGRKYGQVQSKIFKMNKSGAM